MGQLPVRSWLASLQFTTLDKGALRPFVAKERDYVA